jgi:cytochrome c oxidase assembly factor CtaG/putative copper export protein
VSGGTRRVGAWVVLAAPALMGTVALVAIGLTGGLAPLGIDGLPDPGPRTRVGLPAVQVLRDLASMMTVGLLVLAATCVPPRPGSAAADLGPVRRRLVAYAQLTATLWVVASLALVTFTYSDASGSSIGGPGFGSEAVFFAFGFEVGQYGMWGAGLAAVVAAGCVVTSGVGGLGVTTVLALLALWPMALSGHAAGTLAHDDAVNLQFFHLVGISVWLGGLVALALVGRSLGETLVDVVRRYSVLAGWCLAAVAVSGFWGAWLRLPSLASTWTTYGAILGIKIGAVVVLAGAGWWHRHRTIARLADGATGAFARLVGAELVVLLGAAGMGVALSRTAPPAPEGAPVPLTAAQSLLGADLPGPLDAAAWVSSWNLDTLFLFVGVAGLVGYLAAVVRLRRRGVTWSWMRTTSWLVGCLLFIWATNGAPGVYGRVLFSMHMVQHMTIATGVPVFLVLGTPVTLALRALRPRRDGSRGPREWLLAVSKSLPLHVLGHPAVAAGMFVVSMIGFYYTSAFEVSLESHTGHILMTVHFLLTGYLFAEAVIGADPALSRPPYPMRVLLVMVTFGFHALFAVSMMASTTVFAEDWFGALGRPWGRTLIDEQYLGAQVGWLMGEYPILIMAAALVTGWVKADHRERRRFDRREERRDDRELAEYNAYLERLHGADLTRRPAPPTMEARRSGQATEKEPHE